MPVPDGRYRPHCTVKNYDINKPIKAQVTLLLLAKKIKNKGFDVSSKVINNSIENNYQGLFWDNVKETKTKPNRNIAF